MERPTDSGRDAGTRYTDGDRLTETSSWAEVSQKVRRTT